MTNSSRELLASLKQSIDELVAPLEAAQAGGKTPVQNGLEFIMGDLTMVTMLLSDMDGNVAPGELDCINDLRRAACGEQVSVLASGDYMQLCRDLLRQYPRERLSVDVIPASIRYLLDFDHAHGTQFADKARALFMQFGEALVRADENKDAVESMVLANFRDTLYPPSA